MLDKPKKRHKDYKRIVTMKTLDTSVYREGLFIGFEGQKDDGSPRYYVFKVIEKTRNINKNHINRDNASYIAEFHGYFTPTEEEIENASF